MKRLFMLPIMALIASCANIEAGSKADEPTTSNYTEPSVSGLSFSDHYPTSNDVCVILKNTSFTEPFVKEGYFLMACPKHEKGAISDRMHERAVVVANTKHWAVLRAVINE